MSHHTLLHRTVRPLVRGLARTGIAPDVVTTCRLLSGLAASVCMLAGQGVVMGIGAGILVLSMLLDRIDGALARATGCFSRFGSMFDLVADCVSTMALFVGLGIGVGARPGGIATVTGLGFGMVAAISVAVMFVALNRHEPPAAACRPFDPDDAMLVVPLLIWFDQAWWLLLMAATLAPVAAIASMLLRPGQGSGPGAKPEARRRISWGAAPVPEPYPVSAAYPDNRPNRSVSTS